MQRVQGRTCNAPQISRLGTPGGLYHLRDFERWDCIGDFLRRRTLTWLGSHHDGGFENRTRRSRHVPPQSSHLAMLTSPNLSAVQYHAAGAWSTWLYCLLTTWPQKRQLADLLCYFSWLSMQHEKHRNHDASELVLCCWLTKPDTGADVGG